MPWALAKDESKKARLETVLYNLVEGISIGTALLAPFLPETSSKIVEQLNTQIRDFDSLSEFGLYPSGNKVTEKPEILFARLDLNEVMDKVNAKKEAQQSAAETDCNNSNGNEGDNEDAGADDVKETNYPEKPLITYDDFAKLEFRVGEIIACEEVKKSKKLLCSQVKIGTQVKQIVSGIKAYYTPEQMVGKKVMVVVNLKPATLAGLTSEGMLLCAEDENGELALMKPEKDLSAGSEIC